MLDPKDFEALQKMMESVVGARVTESETRMDARIAESEARMESMLTVKIKEAENLLLEEIDRTQTKLENKINLLNENLDKLEQYYRISKLENDNTTVLLKLMEGLAKRVEDLEKKIA